MLTDEQFDTPISTYIYTDLSLVDVVATERITKNNWGRFDGIVKKYYGRRADANKYVKLLLDFNNIPDATQVSIGTIIRIPDMQSLERIISIDESDLCPGVNSSTEIIKKGISSDQTTAQPILAITMESVKYDASKGVITF